MGSNFWEWYEKFVFQIVDQEALHSFHIRTSKQKADDEFLYTVLVKYVHIFSVYPPEGRFQAIANLDPSIA